MSGARGHLFTSRRMRAKDADQIHLAFCNRWRIDPHQWAESALLRVLIQNCGEKHWVAERVGFEPTVPFGCTRSPSVTLGTGLRPSSPRSAPCSSCAPWRWSRHEVLRSPPAANGGAPRGRLPDTGLEAIPFPGTLAGLLIIDDAADGHLAKRLTDSTSLLANGRNGRGPGELTPR